MVAMTNERKAQLSASRLRSEAKWRQAKNFMLKDIEVGVRTRMPEHLRSNAIINKAIKWCQTQRATWKINLDGSPMTIDDEINYRKLNGMSLLKAHYLHLGLPLPAKRGVGDEEKAPLTAAELEQLKPSLTAEEYAELAKTLSQPQPEPEEGDEEAEAA